MSACADSLCILFANANAAEEVATQKYAKSTVCELRPHILMAIRSRLCAQSRICEGPSVLLFVRACVRAFEHAVLCADDDLVI